MKGIFSYHVTCVGFLLLLSLGVESKTGEGKELVGIGCERGFPIAVLRQTIHTGI